MLEAIRIAQEAEKAEEEELMRRAIEESESHLTDAKKEEEEEAELIRQAIEASAKEEAERKEAVKVEEDQVAVAKAKEELPPVEAPKIVAPQ